MKLNIALKDKLMDVRLRDKHLFQGKITKKEINSYLDQLPDSSENSEYVEVEDDSEESE